MRCFRLLACTGLSLGLGLGASACSDDGPTQPLPGTGVRLQEVVAGLSSPLYLTAPVGDARLFIVEKVGTVRIVKDGVLLAEPFLDISAQVTTDGERGLLGLAFDPEFATTGTFVVHYTDLGGNTALARFQISSTDPDRADPATQALILTETQPFANHNGGQVTFGPDGFLYLGLGDGGSGGDPGNRGQGLSELLGAILRIDVKNGAPYTVPADNPFVGQADVRPEVWSYGLRNPWRFSFDRLNGDLYIADVGEVQREEIDVAPATEGLARGLNFGWNTMEGTQCFLQSGCDQTGLTLPVLDYDHTQGCSIIGGYVYRGSALPALQGQYFYGDLCQRWVRSFRYAGGSISELTDWAALRPGGPLLSFGEDAAGELYVLDEGGRVSKIVPE